MNPEIAAKLRDVLADLYPHEADLRRVIGDAGITATRIELNSSAVNNWQAVLDKVQRVDKVDALLDVVAQEYGISPEFRQVYDAYQAVVGQPIGQATGRANDQRRRISHSILPWLVNRREQVDELGLAFRQWQARPGRPLLCLVHGEDQECHDKFVDRLQVVVLADLLPDLRAKGPIRRIALDWPTHTRSVDELHEKLAMRLAEAIQDIQANPVEINAQLSASPVLIETYFLIQEWTAQTPAQINGFVEFWQQWPPLAPGQYLIVCLCLKCLKPKPNLWKFWQRTSATEMIDAVNQALLDRQHFLFDRYDQVHCKVLPQLRAVTLQEAHNWPLLDEVKRHCPGRDLLADLKAIFDHDPAKTLPMRELGQRLGQLLAGSVPMQEEEL